MSDLPTTLTTMLKKPRKKKKIAASTLLMHLKSGMKVSDIAKLYDMSDANIRYHMNKHGLDMTMIRSYQQNKGDLISAKASAVLESIDGKKIAKAGLRDSVTAFNVLNNAERLEHGKSTSNIEIHSLNKSIDDLQAMEDKLMAEIEALKGKFKV